MPTKPYSTDSLSCSCSAFTEKQIQIFCISQHQDDITYQASSSPHLYSWWWQNKRNKSAGGPFSESMCCILILISKSMKTFHPQTFDIPHKIVTVNPALNSNYKYSWLLELYHRSVSLDIKASWMEWPLSIMLFYQIGRSGRKVINDQFKCNESQAATQNENWSIGDTTHIPHCFVKKKLVNVQSYMFSYRKAVIRPQNMPKTADWG